MLTPLIEHAFADRQDIKAHIERAIGSNPELTNLFDNIAYILIDAREKGGREISAGESSAPVHGKKRKLDHANSADADWSTESLLAFNEISFAIPQRKKLRLEIGVDRAQGIRAVNLSNKNIEFVARWKGLREVVCLPVPEKSNSQYNFCFFTEPVGASNHVGDEQVMFTLVDTVTIKDGALDDHVKALNLGISYKDTLQACLNKALAKYDKRVIEPSVKEFTSNVTQQLRKGEVAFHIKAFRGAKEGYLFLLPSGIVWGFKKPLEYFSFDLIDSVSYTSVLQRTFNINLTIRLEQDAASYQDPLSESTGQPDSNTSEFEFSMIDQADFAGIDEYVKRHALQDASMAEQRRAKKVNVNGHRGKQNAAEQDEQDEGGELAKAAREADELQKAGLDENDDDEEDDENFDPGSAGESEGEGSSSGEDDDQEPNEAEHEVDANDDDDDADITSDGEAPNL